MGYLNLGDYVWQVEGPAAGLGIHRDGIDFARSRGLRQAEMWIRTEATWALFESGQWDEVVQVADQVTSWEGSHGGSQLRGIAVPSRARVELFRGRVVEAAELVAQVLPLARDVGDLQVLLPALGTAALVQQIRGDTPSAVRLAEEWLERNATLSSWLRALNLPDVLSILMGAGMLDPARALIEEFVPRCAHESHTLVAGRAALAETVGHTEEAASLYAEAADLWREFGNVVETGRCLLGLGQCLVGLGRPEATGRLREAREVFVRLEARALWARADALLEQASALSS